MSIVLVACAALAMCTVDAAAQSARCEQIWTVQAVEIHPGMLGRARRYYEAGWLRARQEAVRRGVIADYRLLATQGTGDEGPQMQLITVYSNQNQFAEREGNFRAIFQTMSISPLASIDGKSIDEIIASRAGREDYTESFGSGDCSDH